MLHIRCKLTASTEPCRKSHPCSPLLAGGRHRDEKLSEAYLSYKTAFHRCSRDWQALSQKSCSLLCIRIPNPQNFEGMVFGVCIGRSAACSSSSNLQFHCKSQQQGFRTIYGQEGSSACMILPEAKDEQDVWRLCMLQFWQCYFKTPQLLYA